MENLPVHLCASLCDISCALWHYIKCVNQGCLLVMFYWFSKAVIGGMAPKICKVWPHLRPSLVFEKGAIFVMKTHFNLPHHDKCQNLELSINWRGSYAILPYFILIYIYLSVYLWPFLSIQERIFSISYSCATDLTFCLIFHLITIWFFIILCFLFKCFVSI